jgi:hypothetical protein
VTLVNQQQPQSGKNTNTNPKHCHSGASPSPSPSPYPDSNDDDADDNEIRSHREFVKRLRGLFDELFLEVYEMLRTESFAKFRYSEEYQSIFNNA